MNNKSFALYTSWGSLLKDPSVLNREGFGWPIHLLVIEFWTLQLTYGEYALWTQVRKLTASKLMSPQVRACPFLEPLSHTVQLGVGGEVGRCYAEISVRLSVVGGISAELHLLGPQRPCRIFIQHGGRDREGRKWSNFLKQSCLCIY